MPNFAPLKSRVRSFAEVLQWLDAHGFQVTPPSGGGNSYRVTKNGCVAAIEAVPDRHLNARISSFPELLIAGEPAELVDRGYQKFLKTSKIEIAATAEHLQQLHSFAEELKEALGYTSLYNEGLGSVSASYQYDRLKSRDLPSEQRPERPWQK